MLRPELVDELIMCVECGEVKPPKLDEDGNFMTLEMQLIHHVKTNHSCLISLDSEITRLMRTHRVYRYHPAENMELSNTFNGNVFDIKGE